MHRAGGMTGQWPLTTLSRCSPSAHSSPKAAIAILEPMAGGTSAWSGRGAIEPQHIAVVPMRSRSANMFCIDLWSVLDDVHQRHTVTSAQIIVSLEPRQDFTRLYPFGIIAFCFRLLNDLSGCLARPGFDCVQIRLK